MPIDSDTPPEGHQRSFGEGRDSGLVDRLLKRLIPNGTVMRRYLLGTYVGAAVFGFVAGILIERTDGNANRSQQAICAVIVYAEKQAKKIDANPDATPGAAASLRTLADDMRATGVHCAPREQGERTGG